VGDGNAIFGIISLGSVRREAYNTTKVKIIDILFLFANLQALKSEVPVVCLVTGCVSRRRDRRYFHSFELRVNLRNAAECTVVILLACSDSSC
jgi:hypothetical protein